MRHAAQDPLLPQVLTSLRASGRKVFLATNSLWDYTHVVMNFLLNGGAAGAAKTTDWLRSGRVRSWGWDGECNSGPYGPVGTGSGTPECAQQRPLNTGCGWVWWAGEVGWMAGGERAASMSG